MKLLGLINWPLMLLILGILGGIVVAGEEAPQCSNIKMKYWKDKKIIQETRAACFLTNPVTKKINFVSTDCKDSKCRMLATAERTMVTIQNTQFSNPYFRLCEKLGGNPGVVAVGVAQDNNWRETDLCHWGKSFIEIDFLLAAYKDNIIYN